MRNHAPAACWFLKQQGDSDKQGGPGSAWPVWFHAHMLLGLMGEQDELGSGDGGGGGVTGVAGAGRLAAGTAAALAGVAESGVAEAGVVGRLAVLSDLGQRVARPRDDGERDDALRTAVRTLYDDPDARCVWE